MDMPKGGCRPYKMLSMTVLDSPGEFTILINFAVTHYAVSLLNSSFAHICDQRVGRAFLQPRHTQCARKRPQSTTSIKLFGVDNSSTQCVAQSPDLGYL